MLLRTNYLKKSTVILGVLVCFSCSSSCLFGIGLPFSKIDHAVEIKNNCEKVIDAFHVDYGKHYFPNKTGQTLGRHISAVYSMAMRIPDTVNVSWIEINKQSHKVEVPLKSLIKNKELRGSSFDIVFHVCNDKLTVYFDKEIALFKHKRRQLWPQPSKLAAK